MTIVKESSLGPLAYVVSKQVIRTFLEIIYLIILLNNHENNYECYHH